MKRIGLLLLLLMLTLLPCRAKSQPDDVVQENKPFVFIYHIPDDDEESVQEVDSGKTEELPVVITSDDITADTSGIIVEDFSEENSQDYLINDMYSDVLKGYAEYNEGEEHTITLDDNEDNILSLNIPKPFRVQEKSFTELKTSSLKFYDNQFSKYNAPEYSISPLSSTNYRSAGGFSAGTMYSQGIDYGELEQSSGVFSRYKYKQFAVSTAYMKTVNTTNNNYNDNFYFAPELQLNQYFTLKEILSADVTKERKKAEFVLSINPFGKRDEDRLRFELGASQTYDNTNALIKNQFKFSTNIKL